jgi:hypothetical protein
MLKVALSVDIRVACVGLFPYEQGILPVLAQDLLVPGT